MPLESILHHSHQSYQSDIWPVGVILLQFVIRKYNIFNNVRMINKPNNVKNCYYINYIVELANFFGCQDVIDQCKNLGYELKLPKDIESFKFRDIANMYLFDHAERDTMTCLTTSSIDCLHSILKNASLSRKP
jgi:cell division control protein 7